MIKINKKIEYALMILKHMQSAEDHEYVSAREICQLYNAPSDTVAKVMQKLNKHQVLSSQQGSSGGYKLSANLEDISYSKLVQIVEGSGRAKDCIELKCSLFSTCNIISPIRKLNQKFNSLIENISLNELLEETSNQEMTKREMFT